MRNTLLPVNLNDRTCIITDNVSIKYIPPTIGRIRGIFRRTARLATAPPKAMEPVSPIKTLAGYALWIRKPKHAPARAVENNDMELNPHFKATMLKKDITIKVTPDARPSSPSVKFTLFTVPTTTNAIKGTYRIPKSR